MGVNNLLTSKTSTVVKKIMLHLGLNFNFILSLICKKQETKKKQHVSVTVYLLQE